MDIYKKNTILISFFIMSIFFIYYYIPTNISKKNQSLWTTYSRIFSILIFFVAIVNYINNKSKEKKENVKIYIDSILKELLTIDEYLLKYYDDLKIPFNLIYNKVQMPSSNINLNKKLEDLSPKSKDYLFILFNKITYLLEKIYFTDEKLFDNSNIGLKIQLFIDNGYYYEYWITNSFLYNIEFTKFINKKYKFLNYNDTTYYQSDSHIYFIPKTTRSNFNFNKD